MSTESRTGSAAASLVWGLVVLVGLLLLGYQAVRPRVEAARSLDGLQAQARQPRKVRVAEVKRAPLAAEFELPGTVAPWAVTPLFARGSGYVQRLFVDIGDRVKKGQLLAELSAPEVDEEVRAAAVRVDEAERNAQLASDVAARQGRLAKEGAVSRLSADEAARAANAAEGAKETARAELSRRRSLRSYLRVTAPFDGLVTRRLVEVGGLASGALFELSRVEEVKLLLDVPQSLAPSVKEGMAVKVRVRGLPGDGLEGKVVRTAGALEPVSRTLRTEVSVGAAPGLLAGAFATVRFSAPRPGERTVVPAAALVLRKEGPQVLQVKDGKAHYVPVRLGWDGGKVVEVASGLEGGEQLVLNAPDSVEEGDALEVVAPEVPRAK
jgi:RND family efflux transporter MFP subunit